MKGKSLVLGLVMHASPLVSQDLPGLNYCLLFDSRLEKMAFQEAKSTECDPMILLLAYDPEMDSTRYEQVRDEISGFANFLEGKKNRYRDESDFLNFLFNKVHQKYLKQFKGNEPFEGIFNGGTYNCVSGTALYACILNQLNYEVRLLETRYHLFLVVTLPDSTHALFEATDPLQGFIFNETKIEKQIKGYLANERETLLKGDALSAPFNGESILNQVSFIELAGLHYYNIAVDLANKKNFYDAFRALRKANILYPSSLRITDLLELTRLRYDDELTEAYANN